MTEEHRLDEAWVVKNSEMDEPVKDIEIPIMTDEERKKQYGSSDYQPVILHYWSGGKKEVVCHLSRIKKEKGEL